MNAKVVIWAKRFRLSRITDEIKRNIWAAVEDCDIGIIEVGGTVGGIGAAILEAIRQMPIDAGEEMLCYS